MVAEYPDTQPKDSHIAPHCNIQQYTIDELTAYWTTIYTLGLIAGIHGTDQEKADARAAVMQALEDAVDTVASYEDAISNVADDYGPSIGPGAIASTVLGSRGRYAREYVRRGIEDFFGYDTSDNDERLEDLDQRIRDANAVKLGRAAAVRKSVKGIFGADTSAEDAQIADSANIAARRNQEISDAVERLWNGIKEVARARYDRFMQERNQCGVGYALQTLRVDASFIVVEFGITIGAGAITGGAGAVALRIAIVVGRIPGKVIVKITRSTRAADSRSPNEGEFKLDQGKMEQYAKDNDGYADDLAGHENRPADREPGGPDGDGDNDAKDKKDSNSGVTDAQRASAEEHGVDPEWVNPDGTLKYPDGVNTYPEGSPTQPNGFQGQVISKPIPAETTIGRYGGPNGNFFAPENTPFDQRAMALSNRYPKDQRIYKVLRPIPAQQGTTAPWFGKPGGGKQFMTDMSERELLEADPPYIELIRKEPFRDE